LRADALWKTFKLLKPEGVNKVVKASFMSEMIRSFLAFDINNEQVLQRFKEVQIKLAQTGADLKPVEPQNIHITMRFLGDITSSTADKVLEAMKQVVFSAFDCNIHGVGVFPDLHYPRVVWAGIKKGADELRNIFDQIEPSLTRLSVRPDSKGFSPHLTLARVRSGRKKAELASRIKELADYDFGVVHADCLRLKKSVLTPKGPIYSTLKEVCH
jgi:2'-5' RNA ligase